MNAISTVLEQVKKETRPAHLKIKEVDETLQKINTLLKKAKIKATIHPGGSYAKETFLNNNHDIDLFVAFDLSYKDQDISSLLAKALQSLSLIRLHGSRDYFQIKNRYNIEIVPVLAIKKASDAQNVTDFSPWHVAWVQKKGKKLKDDIRLAKQFCKAARIYGAESYLSGFSGHVLDILVIYYNGFLNLLKKSQTWKEQSVIDYNNTHKGKALLNLNKSKTQSGLVVVDPVQPNRNASAALSLENMEKFKEYAAAFLKKPSTSFFEEKKIDLAILKKKNALLAYAQPHPGKKDVVGAKAVKAFNYIKNQLQKEFGIKESDWDWKDEFIMWFIPKKTVLSDYKEHEGPPLDKKEFVEIFTKKYKNTYTKKEKIYAKVKRAYTSVDQLFDFLIKTEYVKEKFKTVKR